MGVKPELNIAEGQFTVKELIEELKKFPEDLPVWHEGCDCFGEANGVKLNWDGSVLITRPN